MLAAALAVVAASLSVPYDQWTLVDNGQTCTEGCAALGAGWACDTSVTFEDYVNFDTLEDFKAVAAAAKTTSRVVGDAYPADPDDLRAFSCRTRGVEPAIYMSVPGYYVDGTMHEHHRCAGETSDNYQGELTTCDSQATSNYDVYFRRICPCTSSPAPTPLPTPVPTMPGVCALPDAIDPDGACTPDEAGYANVDMDSYGDAAVISLALERKPYWEDSDGVPHGETDGEFIYDAANGRYTLPCKQTAGQKTIKVNVTRPSYLTEFGGEWVQAFPKDSWENITNAYEPFTFNDFGSKIPLQEFRPTTVDEHGRTIANDAKDFPTVAVYMEMSSDGDYEFKYGNPYLSTSTGKWIAFEFKKSLLRVGGPWSSTCGDVGAASPSLDVGAIVPLFLGNPSLLIHEYRGFAATLQTSLTGDAAAVPMKVILPIFTPENEGADGVSTWTEGDKGLTAKHCKSPWVCPDPSATSWDPVTKTGCMPQTEANGCTDKPYTGCYASGRACPLDHAVCSIANCELNRWKEIIGLLKASGADVEVLGLIETQQDGASRSAAEINADITSYETLAPVDGYFYNEAGVGGKATIEALMAINAAQDSKFTVFGIGTPLFEKAGYLEAAGAPDSWVTLSAAADSLGVWTPYSWFPYENSSTFGAIVHSTEETGVVTTLTTLVDRGYGYVYLHSDQLFNSTSEHLDTLITELGKASTGNRRLAGRGLQADDGVATSDGVATTRWGCDDTLFYCAPVCLQTVGVTTSTVAASKCAALEAPDACSCPCFYAAEWVCTEDGRVVCQARSSTDHGGPLVVGDLVCAGRGTPKPKITQELRAAGSCPATPVERGMRPAEQCQAQQAQEAAVEQAQEWELDQSIDLILNAAVPMGPVALALLLAVTELCAQ